MDFGKLAGIAALISIYWPGVALADSGLVLPAEVVMSEHENKAVKVSGTEVVGVMFAGTAPIAERPSLSAYVPKSLAGDKVCMHAVSLDGVYETVYSYEVPVNLASAGILGFDYPTNYPKRVSNDPGTDLGMLLAPGPCAGEPDSFLVGYWNTAAQEGGSPVILMLNSLGADEVFVFLGTDLSADAIDCTPVLLDRPRAYDHICTLPAGGKTDGEELRVEINVVRSGVRDPAKTVTLLVDPS